MNEVGTRVRGARDSSVRALVSAALLSGLSPEKLLTAFQEAAPKCKVPHKTTREITDLIEQLGQFTPDSNAAALTVESVEPVEQLPPNDFERAADVISELLGGVDAHLAAVEPSKAPGNNITINGGDQAKVHQAVKDAIQPETSTEWWLDGLAVDSAPMDPISECVRKAREDRIAFIKAGGDPYRRFCSVVEFDGVKFVLVSTLRMKFEDGTMLNWSGSMKSYLSNAVAQCNRDFEGVFKGRSFKGTAWGYLHKHNPKADEFWLWSNVTDPNGVKKDIVDKAYVQCITVAPFMKIRIQKITS